MYRPQIARLMATPMLQLSATKLAPPPLLMRQRWVAPAPHIQQIRRISVLEAAICLTVPTLVIRVLRRIYINKKLETTLQQTRQLQDQEKRRQVFFDVARRYAKNNGSSVDFKDSPKESMDASLLGAPTSICNVTVLDPHNVRYSIQRGTLRRWKVWVAVDAEFDLSSSAIKSASSCEPNETDSDGDELLPEVRASREPLTWAVVFWMNQKLAEACKATSGQFEDGSGHVEVPEKVDIELLFWDTVVSLELNTRTHDTRTSWVGKIGERRPSRFRMIIIPIPALFDI